MVAVSDMNLAEEGILEEFEGEQVTQTGVEVRNAGGGLNKSLMTDPTVMHKGDTVYVVMQCDVTQINFKPIKDEEDKVMRVHVMRATDVTFLDAPQVKKALDEQRKRNKEFAEAQAGILRLPLEDASDPGPSDPQASNGSAPAEAAAK